MKLAVFSDLHLDQVEAISMPLPQLPTSADIIILAGDIHQTTHGLDYAASHWPDREIIYVPGNHEFFGTNMFALLEQMRRKAAQLSIRFLSNNVATVGTVRFLGTPLYTDFSLYGLQLESERQATRLIPDFSLIRERGGKQLTTATMKQLHWEAKTFLARELEQPWTGKTVVVTHWLPIPKCIEPQFYGDRLTPYFCTDCTDLLSRYSVDLWVCGHSHYSVDFVHESGCRFVSNQRGYAFEGNETNRFRPDFVVEL